MIRVLGFDFQQGQGIFLFTMVSRPALGPTQAPLQWAPVALFLGVKRPGREADHPICAEVKREWSHICTPQYVLMVRCLVKHRDDFILSYGVNI
jgi:hypothetical protein